jgi:hypothetical protein
LVPKRTGIFVDKQLIAPKGIALELFGSASRKIDHCRTLKYGPLCCRATSFSRAAFQSPIAETLNTALSSRQPNAATISKMPAMRSPKYKML